MYVDKITIPIFIKLLDISIVANSLLGRYSSCSIFSFFFSFIKFICLGDNEKNAVSLPDINPEKQSRMISKIILRMIVIVMGLTLIFTNDKLVRK